MSADTYKCSHCGAQFGITGPGEGTDEDYAAEEYYRSEVEYHETQCQRAEYIAGLRALADALEALPEIRLPLTGSESYAGIQFAPRNREDFAAVVALMTDPVESDHDNTGRLHRCDGRMRGLRIFAMQDKKYLGGHETTRTVTSYEVESFLTAKATS